MQKFGPGCITEAAATVRTQQVFGFAARASHHLKQPPTLNEGATKVAQQIKFGLHGVSGGGVVVT
jgi:hypothetical protein